MDSRIENEKLIIRQRIAGAALIDPSIRGLLRDDPRAALERIGVELPDEEYEELRRLLRDVDWDAAEVLGPLVRATLPRMPQQVAAWG